MRLRPPVLFVAPLLVVGLSACFPGGGPVFEDDPRSVNGSAELSGVVGGFDAQDIINVTGLVGVGCDTDPDVTVTVDPPAIAPYVLDCNVGTRRPPAPSSP